MSDEVGERLDAEERAAKAEAAAAFERTRANEWLVQLHDRARACRQARAALLELVDALALDDKPRGDAIRKACELLDAWGTPPRWRVP